MRGYKAFKKGLICKDKQYAENTVFEEKEAVICNCGMHFCKNPLDVLEYYPLVDENGELIILMRNYNGDEIFLEPIEDEDEFMKIGKMFEERLADIFDFDDEE